MLRVEAVQKSFDGFIAVRNANLTVDEGEIVAVIGPNGAGNRSYALQDLQEGNQPVLSGRKHLSSTIGF